MAFQLYRDSQMFQPGSEDDLNKLGEVSDSVISATIVERLDDSQPQMTAQIEFRRHSVGDEQVEWPT